MDSIANRKLILRPGTISVEKRGVLFEPHNIPTQVVLPLRALPILEELQKGETTMKYIIKRLYNQGHKVSFKVLVQTVELLFKNKCFESEDFNEDYEDTDFISLGALLIPSTDIKLFSKLKFSNYGKFSKTFHVLAYLALILGAFGLVTSIQNFSWDLRIEWNDNPLTGSFLFFTALSFLISFRNMFKTFLLMLMNGSAFNLSLRASPLSFTYHVQDDFLFATQSKSTVFLYTAASMAAIFIPFAVDYYFDIGLFQQNVFLVATFVYFFTTNNPFHKGDIKKIVNMYVNKDLLSSAEYLMKNNSVITPFEITKDQTTQTSYLWTYSLFSLAWSAITLSLISVATLNQYKWLAATTKFQHKLALGLFVIVGIICLFHIVIDLTLIFFKNVYQKTQDKIISIKQQIGTSEESEIDIDNISKLIQSSPVFNNVPIESIAEMAKLGHVNDIKPGVHVIVQGNMADHVFILLAGEVEIRKRDTTNGYVQRLTSLQTGSVFGEMAIFNRTPRTADVVATQTSKVFKISAENFKKIFNPEDESSKFSSIADRIILTQHLFSNPLFANMAHETLQIFYNYGTVEHIEANKSIIEQDTMSDDFYFILRGAVKIFLNGEVVSSLKQGDFFGEIAILQSVPRTASVRALEETVVLKLNGHAMWQILVENIDLALFFESVAEKRLTENFQAAA